MLGHADDFGDRTTYNLQTIMDNVRLLTPEVLDEINAVVVACGYRTVKKKKRELRCRVDSAVAKTHVEWPTDVGLLNDAMRCLLRSVHATCQKHAIQGWRKSRDWSKKVRRLFNRVCTSRQRRKRTRVQEYLSLCQFLVEKLACTQKALEACGIEDEKIPYYLRHARRQIDQVERRLIKGEVIPHDEKVFSIHEEHTRWITKGKAGVIAELGVSA